MFTIALRFYRTITRKQGLQVIRSMYGFRQTLGSWNYRFDVIIIVYDLIQNKNDTCLYKEVSGSALTVTVINNDNMSFLGNDIPMI